MNKTLRINCLEDEKLTLCLRDAEERPDAHADEDGAEEEVGSVSQIRDHVRSGPRDDERTEPGIGSSQRHAEHADVEREDLRGNCVEKSDRGQG